MIHKLTGGITSIMGTSNGVNKELILDRLARVRENIKHLKELGKLSSKEFTSDFKATRSA